MKRVAERFRIRGRRVALVALAHVGSGSLVDAVLSLSKGSVARNERIILIGLAQQYHRPWRMNVM